ncbi:MAG TPA: four helix bundle protein [Gemmatimonadaceae bacterium]|nr:four helix bundle protein [Gemmatimonadaceae bacterium]
MAGHRDIIAWRKAMDLAVACYPLTLQLRAGRHADLASQLFRASISVPTNIAEGQGRGTDRDFARFLDISMGSDREVETLVILTDRFGLAKWATTAELLKRTDEVAALIHGLRRSKRPT